MTNLSTQSAIIDDLIDYSSICKNRLVGLCVKVSRQYSRKSARNCSWDYSCVEAFFLLWVWSAQRLLHWEYGSVAARAAQLSPFFIIWLAHAPQFSWSPSPYFLSDLIENDKFINTICNDRRFNRLLQTVSSICTNRVFNFICNNRRFNWLLQYRLVRLSVRKRAGTGVRACWHGPPAAEWRDGGVYRKDRDDGTRGQAEAVAQGG